MRAPVVKQQLDLSRSTRAVEEKPADRDLLIAEPGVAAIAEARNGAPSEALGEALGEAREEVGLLRAFAQATWRRKLIVVVTTCLAVMGSIVAFELAAPRYTSTARLLVQRTGGGPADAAADQNFLLTQEQVITSTPVLAAALGTPGIHEIAALRGHDDAMKLLKRELVVESGNRGDLVSVSFDAVDPQEATRLVAAIVDAYVRFQSGVSGMMADGSLDIVKQEKRQRENELKKKWADLQTFGRENGLAQGNEKVDAAETGLHEMALKLTQAHVETLSAKAAYDEMQRGLKSDPETAEKLAKLKGSDSALVNGDEHALDVQLSNAKSELAGVGLRFLPNHPVLQGLWRRINELQVERDLLIQHRWEAAVEREADLQESYDDQQAQAADDATNQKLYDADKSAVGQLEKEIAGLNARSEELERAASVCRANVTVLEPATAADRPTKAHYPLVISLAGIVGLALGCGLAFVRDRQSDVVSNTDRKLQGAGLPVLARLPALSRRHLVLNGSREPFFDSLADCAQPCLKVQDALGGVIPFCGGTTVLVTSTHSRHGKSTLTSLLAMTLARSGKRVLLVDANARAQAQGRIFGVTGEYGLLNLIEDESETNFVGAISSSSHRSLDLILPGSSEQSSESLLNSQRFCDLLADMAGEYDFVLVDSPALSAAPDARIIASACDATILLERQASLSPKVLNRTRRSLSDVGGNVIGVVLNGGMEAFSQTEAIVSVDVSHQARERVVVSRRVVAIEAKRTEVLDLAQSELSSAASRKLDSRKADLGSLDAASANLPSANLASANSPNADLPSRASDIQEQPIAQVQGAKARPSLWTDILLVIGVSVAGLLVYWLEKAAGTPLDGHFPGSFLLQRQEWLVTVAALGGALLVAMIASGLINRPPWQDAVIFCITAGLGVLSFRGGTMHRAFLAGRGPSGFLMLAFETVMLFVGLLAIWSILQRMSETLSRSGQIDRLEEKTERFPEKFLAMFAHASAMTALMILLSPPDDKMQSLASVGVASFVAAMLAQQIVGLKSSFWFWISPMCVALIGYGYAYAQAVGLPSSLLHGSIATLARPLPLEYASVGPVGAILGYCLAARGAADREVSADKSA